MGRGLTLLVATALAGALAIPFVVLLSLFFFGVTPAVYLFVSWLGSEAVLTLFIGILLRGVATNDASVVLVKFSDESKEQPHFASGSEEVFPEAS